MTGSEVVAKQASLRSALWSIAGHMPEADVRRFVDAVLKEIAVDSERERRWLRGG